MLVLQFSKELQGLSSQLKAIKCLEKCLKQEMASLLQYEVERSQFNNSLISEHIEVFYIKTSLFITDCMFACVPDESSARISWIFVLSDNKRGEG